MHETTWTARDTTIALLVVFIWGLNFVPMKFALEILSPLELGVGRYFFCFFPLIFFVRFPALRLRRVLALALFQAVGQFSLLFFSLQAGMTASLASVLLQTQVFFTALWSFLIFKNRPHALLWISMLAAFIGLVFFGISAVYSDGVQAVTLSGLALILAAGAFWGFSNIITRQAQHESPDYSALGLLVWSGFFATLMYVLLNILFMPAPERWLEPETWAALPIKTWMSVMFLGWASSICGYALWVTLLKRHDANRVAPFSLGVPIVGLAIGLIWLQEPINFWQWCGSAFIGLALILVVFGPRLITKQRKKKWQKC